MGRISKTFDSLQRKGEKALIPFITAGYPDLATTEKLIFEIEKNGADLLELGVPFSDPMADGPVIQYSSEQALQRGINLTMILKLVKKVRLKTEIPIILMGYFNPFFSYGLKRFAEDAKRVGVDGVLVVDLPPEEAAEMIAHAGNVELDLIFLLAPTSDEKRIALIVNNATGFIYYVSVTGVTGVRSTLDRDIRKQVRRIKKITSIPIGVGFGISTPQQAQTIAKWADAVVVGSAIIKKIKESKSPTTVVSGVGKLIKSLKQAITQNVQ
jgi:tryptophan synthase alpha chain